MVIYQVLSERKSGSKMASPRPKSPRPVTPNKHEASFWEKVGTIARKKKIREAQEVEEEGKNAIDSPGSPTSDFPPEIYSLEENEEMSMIAPESYKEPRLKSLIQVLVDWLNDELAEQRIIVKDLEADLYDGQVLQKLLEKLTGQKLDVPEVTQSEEGQRQKLNVVVGTANVVLGLHRWTSDKWSPEKIHSKNLVAMLHLLIALARHFRAPIRLPENITIKLIIAQRKSDGAVSHRTVQEELTGTYDDVGMRCERDAFDALFDHAPDKLQVVKNSLITFVNKHLNKLNFEVSELESQFHDGVYLIVLIGLLEGFFVPLYEYHVTPRDHEQKVHNVAFFFQLLIDVGLPKSKARPEDIVNKDLKSTLRVLYNLFTKYRNLS